MTDYDTYGKERGKDFRNPDDPMFLIEHNTARARLYNQKTNQIIYLA